MFPETTESPMPQELFPDLYADPTGYALMWDVTSIWVPLEEPEVKIQQPGQAPE